MGIMFTVTVTGTVTVTARGGPVDGAVGAAGGVAAAVFTVLVAAREGGGGGVEQVATGNLQRFIFREIGFLVS